jgi:hypothetical protein
VIQFVFGMAASSFDEKAGRRVGAAPVVATATAAGGENDRGDREERRRCDRTESFHRPRVLSDSV